MTTLVTADLHLADNPRDAYRRVFFEETLPHLIREHSVTRVLILGDICEAKDAHRAPLVNRVVDGFAALAAIAKIYVLKGNHDYTVEDVPFFRFLSHLDRVYWINEPTPLKMRGLGDCLFLPHTKNLEDWVDLIFDVGASHDWFFCHQTFRGADMGHGFRAEDAVGAPFTKNARVISGDVHVPQKIGPVTYVGSPYRIDFGDEFEPRVLLLDGDKMRSIPVEGPQKRLVEIDSLDALDAQHGIAVGDVIKVRLKLAGGDELALGRPYARKLVQEWADKVGVTLYAVQVVQPEAARAEKTAARARPRRSDESLIRAYAKKMGKGRAAEAVGLKIAEETA